MSDETPPTQNAPQDSLVVWRERCYVAEKWLSRLLGISLSQVVYEAERRVDHPLGLDEEWQGSRQEWRHFNVTILEGALAREKVNAELKGRDPCQCADCRGVWIDLDRVPPDTEGHPPPDGHEHYLKVSPTGEVLK
jgi:hypothetical protein